MLNRLILELVLFKEINMLFILCSGNVEDNMRINEVLFSKISRVVQDIDTLEDWRRAEIMYEAIQKNK
jgi:hypothetical protein